MKRSSIIIQVFFAAIILLFASASYGQSSHQFLLEADKDYENNQYELAEEKYRKAKVESGSAQATYNLGNSLYQQERYEEAVNQYLSAANLASDDKVKAKALHNLGNAHFQNENVKESLQAYRQSLELNPDDVDTKMNFLKAKRQMKMMQQQQQQQQQQGEGEEQDQEQQENQEQQQQQEGDPSDQQQQSNEGENDEQQEPQEQDSSSDEGAEGDEESKENRGEEFKKTDMDKEDARKLLEIIEGEEQKVQEKLRKIGNKKKPKKDW